MAIALPPSPSSRQGEQGSALVEAALMMPLFFTLALGTFEFGRALQHHHVINKSMRDAARYLARVDVNCPAPTATGTITDGAHLTAARNLALTGYSAGGTPLISYWTDPATISVTVTCLDNTAGALRGPEALPVIRTTASVPYTDAGFLGVLGLGPVTFTIGHEEPHIGE